MLRTTQISGLKTAFEGVSTLLGDTTLILDPEVGVVIKELDKTGRILVSLVLEKDAFDTFEVSEKRFIGLDLSVFTRCLKGVDNNEILEIKFGETTTTVILKKGKVNKKFILKNLNLPEPNHKFPPISFDYKVALPSSLLNSWCKQLSSLSDKVKITTSPSKLTFSSDNDVEFEISTGVSLSIEVSSDTNSEVSGEYDIKFFSLLSKCSSISEEVILYLKEDYPIILEYSLASLGHLMLVFLKVQ